MRIPKPISNLIESFERLPGIGPKTASRLTFYLLHFPQEELEAFASALTALKTGTKLCSVCKNVGEQEVCFVCGDTSRDKDTIAVVSGPLDVFALEKTGYKGVYHVLHGVIDPLNNIGPDELYIDPLIKRLKDMRSRTDTTDTVEDGDMFAGVSGAAYAADTAGATLIEVILATGTNMEGESTAMYIQKLVRDNGLTPELVKISRIARGLPVGGDIEYADDNTLSKALEGRIVY